MNITTDPNLWAICALVFLLGLLIGVFLTAGGRRKWKTRYDSEVERRRELEKAHEARTREWEEREKELRDRDTLRAAAIKDPSEPGDGEVRSV
jgi:C4-dicarboxylate-specific signal transduction histidine kinase